MAEGLINLKSIVYSWLAGVLAVVALFVFGSFFPPDLANNIGYLLWVLPELVGFGGHDVQSIPIMFLGGSIFFGAIFLLVFYAVARFLRKFQVHDAR